MHEILFQTLAAALETYQALGLKMRGGASSARDGQQAVVARAALLVAGDGVDDAQPPRQTTPRPRGRRSSLLKGMSVLLWPRTRVNQSAGLTDPHPARRFGSISSMT